MRHVEALLAHAVPLLELRKFRYTGLPTPTAAGKLVV